MQKYRQAEPANIREIDLSPSVSFAKMRAYSSDLAEMFMTQILLDLVDYFSVGKSMGVKQIELTMKLILKEYYYLKPEDFKLCFTNAQKGLYGTNYDRIDGQIICSWLNIYCAERAEYFELKSENLHERIKSNPTPVNPEVIKLYNNLRNELERDMSKEAEYKKFKEQYLKSSTGEQSA